MKSNKELKIIECKTFFKRLLGFMFKKNIDYILFFPNTNCIHTFFMLNNIDVIMTDKNYKVIFIEKCVIPNRIIRCHKAKHTFEMPNNYSLKYKLGDIIKSK